MIALLAAMTTSIPAAALQPPVKVGLVWGGGGSQNGRWGCDRFCVDRTETLFDGDGRFAAERLAITDVSPESLAKLGPGGVLVMPGGNNDFDEIYGGAGQLAALGPPGLAAIGAAVDRGLLYVGICAGAFLGCQGSDGEYGDGFAGRGLAVHDEDNFGCASVRGLVDLEIPPSEWSDFIPSWGTGIGYDDGPALLVDGDMTQTVQLARYRDTVQVADRDIARVNESYKVPGKAEELIGKAAMTLTRRGAGRILLVGPHPELSPPEKGIEFLNLIHGLRGSKLRLAKELMP